MAFVAKLEMEGQTVWAYVCLQERPGGAGVDAGVDVDGLVLGNSWVAVCLLRDCREVEATESESDDAAGLVDMEAPTSKQEPALEEPVIEAGVEELGF